MNLNRKQRRQIQKQKASEKVIIGSKKTETIKPTPIGTAYGDSRMWRPRTVVDKYVWNFCFQQGGMGDYINFLPAMEYIGATQPQVVGRVFCNPPFDSVAKFVLEKYENLSVHKLTDFDKVAQTGEAYFAPADWTKYCSATGAHLLDLGFMYFVNHHTPPADFNRLPDLRATKKPDWFTHEKYAVFTPNATAKARTMKGVYINELAKYTLEKDIMPVYLGKKDFALTGKDSDYYAVSDEETDFSLGIDLREKTTLLEATAIMRDAQFVIGVDNGLLHFAGCTEVPVIFGHTVTNISDRQLRRPKGKTINIALTHESLPCTGCQSNMRFIHNHRFKYCIYGDYLCLDLLFANECSYWKKAIDNVIGV